PGNELEPARFRVYGLSTIDGDAPTWSYRIQFATAPDAATRIAIAAAAMWAMDEWPLDDGEAWQWSDRFALLRFTLADEVLSDEVPELLIRPAIDAIHDVAPVVEVV